MLYLKRGVATGHPFFSPLASFGGSAWIIQSLMMDNFFNGALSAIHSFRGYMEQIIILFRPAAFYEDLSYAFGAFFLCKSNASVFVTERRQSTIVWSVLCRFHSLYHCHLLSLMDISCYSLLLVVTRWTTHLSFQKQSQCLAKIYYYLMQ